MSNWNGRTAEDIAESRATLARIEATGSGRDAAQFRVDSGLDRVDADDLSTDVSPTAALTQEWSWRR
ncbi:hypothetical protein [Parafrankia sp. FMc2]|uniref:hypothetical protein n=1 Tax=Parafrankia sp. FMc2 TaxID=3233196 RepID=UPI0034D3FC7B